MKLVKVTTFYPDCLQDFYFKRPELINQSYNQQKQALDYNCFGLADFWSNALTSLGYEVLEITLNAEYLQRQWALENNLTNYQTINLYTIALAQIKRFKPDLLWFNHYDHELLKEIGQENPKIKLVLGWSGSAIAQTNVWQDIDIILSCAPESVKYFRNQGLKSEHLHHGFDPRINDKLQVSNKIIDTCFIGQILRNRDFHLEREQLLENLSSQVDFKIFSNSANFDNLDNLKSLIKIFLYNLINPIKDNDSLKKILDKLPIIKNVVQLQSTPVLPVNPQLKPLLKPAVYGLEMYQTLAYSKIALNIHADSSPLYASNMRLFETTGIGTCLLTDWKDNLTELFEPDQEVVTYNSVDECVEKVKWLLENDQEREAIAKAGQARTLKDHTFEKRAIQLDEIIKENL
jgi:spore maturation protein CgeB